MVSVDLSDAMTHRIQRVVAAFARLGWKAESIPSGGRLSANRQLLVLRTPNKQMSIRLSVYKVGESGRSRPDERRVEITTTYSAGMPRRSDYKDLVLGYDPDNNVYVGLDPERLEHGGPTHNASSFVDRQGLRRASGERILVLAYPAPVLGGTEYQAFFHPERLPEYCFNAEEIHSGQYAGDGIFSGPVSGGSGGDLTLAVPDDAAAGEVLVLESGTRPGKKKPPKGELVRAYEEGDEEAIKRARLTPEQLELIRRHCEENGKLGEQFVLDYERKRLRRLGCNDLAERVEWTSRLSVGEGYDIRSFEEDGSDRLIEVKTTQGTGRTFVITKQEWATAERRGSLYWIYRVTNIRGTPAVRLLQDPVKLEEEGRLKRSADRWKVTIV